MRPAAIYLGRHVGRIYVRDADRDLFQAQLSLAEIRLSELLSVVQLYKALGGGWSYGPTCPGAGGEPRWCRPALAGAPIRLRSTVRKAMSKPLQVSGSGSPPEYFLKAS